MTDKSEDELLAGAQSGAADADAQNAFVVDLGNYEGPLHLLLEMARKQKVDLLHICSLGEVPGLTEEIEATHLISALDPGTPLDRPHFIPEHQHLNLSFRDTDDVTDPHAPTIDHVATIHDWAESVPGNARVVVHCYMGISRSTAITLGLLARHLKPEDAAVTLKEIRPQATPNPLIVAHWDEVLGLNGRLKRAAGAFPLPFWITENWDQD